MARSWAQGIRLAWLVADEDYGQCHWFRQEVASYGISYIVEVPCSLKGWTQRPPTLQARTRERLASWAKPSRRVDQLWERGGPSWETFHIKDTDKGAVVWEVRVSRFCPWEEGLPGPEQWLLIARQVLTGEVKYFLANAPRDTPLTKVLEVAFSRHHIERLFEDAKGQVGLDHFEVRKYQPLIRHLVLSMVSLLFLVRQAAGGGEKKSSWSVHQLRRVAAVLLDRDLTPLARQRKLQRLLTQIDYEQTQAERVRRSHRKARHRALHAIGIWISKLRKCFST